MHTCTHCSINPSNYWQHKQNMMKRTANTYLLWIYSIATRRTQSEKGWMDGSEKKIPKIHWWHKTQMCSIRCYMSRVKNVFNEWRTLSYTQTDNMTWIAKKIHVRCLNRTKKKNIKSNIERKKERSHNQYFTFREVDLLCVYLLQ